MQFMKFQLHSLFYQGKRFSVLFFYILKFVPDKAKKEEEVAVSLAQNLSANCKIGEVVIHTIMIVSVISALV